MIIEKNFTKNFCGSVFLLAIFVSCSLATGSIETRSFSFPIDIDDSYYVRSSMYLRYSFEDYNEPFSEFKVKENSPVVNQFKKVLQDVRDQNTPKNIALSSHAKIAKGYQPSDVYKQFIEFYSRVLSPKNTGINFQNLKLIKQIYIGNDCKIVWEVNSVPEMERGIFRGSFRFKKGPQDDFVWEIDIGDEVGSLISETTRSQSSKFAIPLDGVKCDYEYAIPGTAAGHPVYLQFNGEVCDFNVMNDTTDNEILVFYQQTCHLLAESPELLVDFYTKKSAQRYSSIMEKYPKVSDPYLRQTEIIRQGRKVLFLLNADPVFIVFYHTIKSTMKFPEDVRYDYIIRDPKDSQLRLTNYSYYGLLSQFFSNKSLFIEPFLKPLLEKTETPKQQ